MYRLPQYYPQVPQLKGVGDQLNPLGTGNVAGKVAPEKR